MSNCPVCESSSTVKLDEISQLMLMKAYRESLSVDTSQLLKTDGPPISLLHCMNCDLKWYAPAPSGDPAFYEALQKHDWYYQDDKPEYAYAAKFLRDGMSVLEVGCGKGAFAKFLPQGVSFRGLEFNEEAVRKGMASGLQIDIESVEDHAVKYARAYDVVCHFQVLEHVTNPGLFLAACASLLKPGGILIVAVPSEDSFLAITEGGYLNMPPHHLTRWSDKALGQAIARCGMQPTEYWHESVATYHRDSYASTIRLYAIRRLLGQANRLHATDFFSRMLRRLMRIEVIGSRLSKYGERHFVHRGRGHTVCVVGKKLGTKIDA